MTKRSIAIFLTLIVALITIAKYIESNSIDTSELNPLPIQDKGNNQSLLETVAFHTNRPKQSSPNSIRSGADSDKSKCSMVPKVTELVTTKFAGYILKYPCTAGSKGSIRIEKSENGEILSEEYTLYLGVQLGANKNSIWNDRTIVNDDYESFLIILKSNTKPKSLPIFEELDSVYSIYKKDTSSGLDIYFKTSNQSVLGILSKIKDSSGNSPSVSCYLDAEDEIDDVFSNLYNLQYKYASCNAHWMLTQDISLSIHSFKAEFANDLRFLYESLNPEMKKIIESKPN